MNFNDDLIVKRIWKIIEMKKGFGKIITPYKIAKRSGMNPSTLTNILNGKFKDIRFSTLRKICIGLDISLSKFFDDELFY